MSHENQFLPCDQRLVVGHRHNGSTGDTVHHEVEFPGEVTQTGRWSRGIGHSFSGHRRYNLWVPAACEKTTPCPLVLMLHGCTQSAEEFAALSEMNRIADREGFLVVYPEQSRRANLLRCWNWFEPQHQARDAGEPAILAAIVNEVKSFYKVDPAHVYVVGVSAGAAMAVILGATYPDLFAGIGVSAGVQFRAAHNLTTAWAVIRHGGPDPVAQGDLAFQAMSDGLQRGRRLRMPVIVFQGTTDHRVPLVNATQLIAQWRQTNQRLAESYGTRNELTEEIVESSVPGGHKYAKHSYKEGGGLLMEKWVVEGLGHAWSGSQAQNRYADPKGPNASLEMWRFFRDTSAVWSQP